MPYISREILTCFLYVIRLNPYIQFYDRFPEKEVMGISTFTHSFKSGNTFKILLNNCFYKKNIQNLILLVFYADCNTATHTSCIESM